MKGIHFFLNPSLFFSMATAAKFVQPIKLCRNCHGNKKGGINFFLFLSSNFMKLCRNIHRSMWLLLGVEQIQNGGRCHGNQGAIFLRCFIKFDERN
jgi:hypothetical protein